MSSSSSNASISSTEGSPQPKMKKLKGTPYIPSYMDLSNGPEPCVVCGDCATGYHYRCMTCEGCKGFFRRTIQKNLNYHCKFSGNCIVDKNSRNQCQQCRYRKCVAVGMATDLVLNERQRKAKRKLIEDNRERRRTEVTGPMKGKHEQCYHEYYTEDDANLIEDIVRAYETTSTIRHDGIVPQYMQEDGVCITPEDGMCLKQEADVLRQMSQVVTPSIVKVVEFAKRIPGFSELVVDDQILLLKSCCMEIMCLRTACRYDSDRQALVLRNGYLLTRNDIQSTGNLWVLIEPILEFAVGLSKLNLDQKEIALLAAVLLVQSDRSGLKDPDSVEKMQDAILGAFKRYIAEKRPLQPVHWAKILMKVTDLRTISTRHAERVMCIKIENDKPIPPIVLEMFGSDLGHTNGFDQYTAA